MKDSDPRPMPPEVQRAYRDPLELGELFATEVFSDKDRIAVRDELLRRFVGKYGNAEIESGARLTTATQRVARFKKNTWKSIDLLMSMPEYGGKESVMLELAHVMQPHWTEWWDIFEWSNWDSIARWQSIAMIVLGDRQFRWLAAQHARAAIDLARPQNRRVCLEAIEAAEVCALDPSKLNAARMSAARKSVARADDAYAADAAAYAAYAAAAYAADAYAYAANAADAAAAAYDAAYSDAAAAARLAALTRRLITPTLITSASRGLR
jgi:hypothetical protein